MGNTRHLYNAAIWLVYTLTGLFFSVGIAAIVTGATNRFDVGNVTGQFGAYTASVLVGTYYLILKPTEFRLPWSELVGILAMVGLVLSALFIGLAALAGSEVTINEQEINTAVFIWPSVAVFSAAIVLSFLAVLLDFSRSEPKPVETLDQQLDDLEGAFAKSRLGADQDGK